ncbi:hypothetical protein [Aurantiacibacter aquimixticola]|uniref:Uncharacterized protein n=1 Tax=Aurantiacibacter aquimixticola TaxID=1958945 RepID=A0A419RRT0_9SPHN|nr:hypothetical protein [Aurantiacibacter aquimixticola]RJY08485.1 hypothetical protein D6201_03130 [Aurantiacibacter aquimixticola]
MTDFEFIFVLYALILGLSLVALLSGLGRTLEYEFASDADGREGSFRVGWLTPLMAIFVMLDLMSFWSFAWVVRDLLTVNPATLLGVMTFASAYYVAARLVFPEAPENFRDLDTHYYRTSRTIFGILIALVFVQWAYLLTIEQIRGGLLTPTSVGLTLLFVGMMLAAMVIRNRHVQSALLVALSVRYLVLYIFN